MELLKLTMELPSRHTTSWDVSWRSPKAPNVRILQGTSTKKWWFNEKIVFLDAIVLGLHIYSRFYRKKKYLKVLNWDVHGTSTGRSYGTSRGQNDRIFWGRPRDMGCTCFLNSTHKHFKLTLAGYSRLYSDF